MSVEPAPAVEVEDIFPLSPMQQGMLFHSLYSPEANMYFEQTCWEVQGAVDEAALRRAWELALERQASLRAAFVWEGVDEPVQVIQRGVALPFDGQTWGDVAEAEREARLEAFLKADRARGFDLAQAPLMRLSLLRAGAVSFLVWSHHHLLLDGWSGPLLMQEVLLAYDALRAGRTPALPPAHSYRDYIAWLTEQDPAAAEAYWRRTLRGFARPTPLVVDRAGAPATLDEAANRIAGARLPAEATARLQALARQHALTLNTFVQAAWALLLHRYSGDEDVLFGATVSGRPADLPGAEAMIGLFINTLPVRVQIDSDETALAFLKRLQAQQAEQRQFEHSALVQIQGWSEVPRGTPLFESLLVFESYPVDAALQARSGGLGLRQRASFARTNYPLTFVVSPGRELGLELVYDAGRFDVDAIQRLLGHLLTLLDGLAADLERPVRALPLLTAAERRQFADWNATDVAGTIASLPRLFEAQVRQAPDAPALRYAGQTLTYTELNRRANQLARHLQKLGVGPETLVGVCVEPSFEMIVAVLGALKAGGAFLPLAAHYPAERLRFMIADSGTRLILTQAALVPFVQTLAGADTRGLALDAEWPAIAANADTDLAEASAPEALAYVIYTSGSTGTPKGALLEHRGLSNFCQAFAHTMGVRAHDRVLQFASFSFDAAVAEIFIALLNGACLCLAPRETMMAMPDLAGLIQSEQVTVAVLPPTVLSLLRPDAVPTLRNVTSAGEACTPDIAARWSGGDRAFFNGYGPTETAVGALFSRLAPGNPVTLGRPIANLRAYVLDAQRRPLPVGVPGELCLGGVQVGRGYLNRPELTAEKFIELALDDEGAFQRVYRTGDLVRYRPDGQLEFLGRLDFQVKVRGYRIELGEIEAALQQHPAVALAAVLAREDAPGEKRLVAYLTARADAPPAASLRDFLKARLPDFMLPAAFVTLDQFPLTPNGKIDRRALPAPEAGDVVAAAYVPPQTPTEEIIAGQWAAVLGQARVGARDNFFELGGHSLLATQVVARAREAFQVELPLRSLFDDPTVAGLAAAVDAARRAGDGQAAPPIAPLPRNAAGLPVDPDLAALVAGQDAGAAPVAFTQQRLWFLDQLEPNRPDYNIATAVRLQGALDAGALTRALDEIVRRHAALRTTFANVDGQPVQVIAPTLTLALPVEDLSDRPEAEREAQALRLASAEARAPFDLARGPLVRARLLRLAPDHHIALLTTHHIISDGWSMGLFVSELAALYQACAAGAPSPLPELPVQYADFAHWQRRWLQGETLDKQLAYWRNELAGSPALLELPTDRPRPAVQTSRGATLPFRLAGALRDPFKRLLQHEGATLFMGLLAAFQVLLHRYSGQTDFNVGTPIANRTRTELEGLIGFFANTLVLRARLDEPAGLSFRDLLARVRETSLGAYAHQDLPFEKLVEALQPERNLSHTPLFQVMFVLDNAPLSGFDLAGLRLSPVAAETGAASFDLTLSMREDGQGWGGYIEYNTDLFDAATIQRLVGHLETLITGLLDDPDRPIAELPLLTEAERRQMLVDWNATTAPTPTDRTVHQLFEAWADRIPDAPALVFEDQSLSYAQLDQRANHLAHALRARGVGPDTLVGLCTDRAFDMVVGLLGILKAGGAYLPLDPAYPPDRLAFMLQDSGAPLVLTQQHLRPVVQALGTTVPVLALDADWPALAQHPATRPPVNVSPDHLAYVIYTSGSTGRPKGALLRHAGLGNLAEAQRRAFEITPGTRVLQFSPFSFDASVWETVMALLNGATLVLARQETITGDLLRVLRDQAVTTVTLPPSVLAVLTPQALPALRTVISAGEACSRELVARWAPGRRFFNAYGPTETTVCAAWAQCDPADPLPPSIGRPILNFQLYVLDQHQQPVPVGVPGELIIGGAGVARGYLNRPELTAEKFVTLPLDDDGAVQRYYRTGDLVRYRPDGNLEFLGRIDQQVKVRGFRIELGEIEAALQQHPAVAQAAVLAREDRPGDKRLAAYVARAEGAPPGDDALTLALRDHLRARLPEYMVPTIVVYLERLPLSPSGKVERKALPAPDLSRAESRAYVAPRTETERRLAALCQELLGLERVGVDDNFFDLGGHSLLATQLISRVRETFQAELPLRVLFEQPTVAGLAEAVDQLPRVSADAQTPAITARSREARRMKRADLGGPGGPDRERQG